MKFYEKWILIFLFILFISCILGSVLKPLMDFLAERSSSFAEMVSYRDGVYNYGKIMRRIIMLVAIGVLLSMRQSLGLMPLVSSGFTLKYRWRRNVVTGLAIGLASLTIYGIFTFVLGVQRLENNPPSGSEMVVKPFIYLLEACLIGLFEESLFRGFIFRGLAKDMSLAAAVISGSLFYAVLHFFSFKVVVHTGFQPFAGFNTLAGFFIPHVRDIGMILPFIIGLFIVGVVLSMAYVYTRSLYMSIGLHAGWVFGVKLNHLFLDHDHDMSSWFFGDGHIVSGLFGWIFLLGVLAVIRELRGCRGALSR